MLANAPTSGHPLAMVGCDLFPGTIIDSSTISLDQHFHPGGPMMGVKALHGSDFHGDVVGFDLC
jgi:hypothetical protein